MRLIRAQAASASREGKSDAELLGDLSITRKQRRAIPLSADPDPDVLWRVDIFYTAVGLKDRGALRPDDIANDGDETHGASDDCPSPAGGWSLCRDIHRFGFETFRKLAEAGTKLVDDATAAIEAYPDVAPA